jgi:outer membrane protein assembly factor BamB
MYDHANNGIYSQPAVGDGMVYAVDSRQTLYAIDAASGRERWRFTKRRGVSYGPTLADGTLYIAAGTGVQAVDVNTRTEQWYYSFGYEYGKGLDRGEYHPSDAPTVHDGTVYAGTTGGVVHAVDAATGEKRWTFTAPARRPPGFEEIGGLTYNDIAGAISVSNGTVFVSSWNGNVYALDADTGQPQWSFDAKDQLEGAATVAGDTVYATGDRNMYALDAADGILRWKLNTPEDEAQVARGSPAIADGTLYVGRGTSVENMNLAAVNAEDGTVKWEIPAVLQMLANPSVANGVVYVPASRLLALDADTGSFRWAYDHESTIGGAPPVVDNVLFTGDSDGWLVTIA